MGLTPQLLTETLYALAVEPAPGTPPFVPTEIHVVTTRKGRDTLKSALLDANEGRFFAFCEDYLSKPVDISFNDDSFHIIGAGDDHEIDDITDNATNTATADTIVNLVRRLTEDADTAIHASLAGGRKTMAFYLGYALSLFGRPQDRLSHVLVNAPFESTRDFYYPPRNPSTIVIGEQQVSTDRACVMLADIPFLRVRVSERLPLRLMRGTMSYSGTVSEMQRFLDSSRLVLSRLCSNGQGSIEITANGKSFTMNATAGALYVAMARRAARRTKEDNRFVAFTSMEFVEEYIQEYRFATYVDEFSDVSDNETVQILKELVGRVESEHLRNERRQRAKKQLRDFFLEKRSKIKKRLKDELGEWCRKYEIRAIKKYGATTYGLDIQPDHMEIYDPPSEDIKASWENAAARAQRQSGAQRATDR